MANITDSPKNLRMSDFLAQSGRFGGLAKMSRFVVRIIPRGRLLTPFPGMSAVTRDLMYLCDISDMPGKAFQTNGVRYYGPDEYFPNKTMFDELDVTIICRNSSLEREYFDNWMALINPPHTWDFNYRDDYVADIDLFQFADVGDENGEPIATYKITAINAYPSRLHMQPLMWQQEGIQKLMITFNYTKWLRKGLDPEPESFSLVEGKDVTR